MPVKIFDLPELGPVHVYKRRGSRNIRLSVNSAGQIRVSMPTWTPYRAALVFVRQKQNWLLDQQTQHTGHLQPNQRLGKHHTLYFRAKLELTEPRSRVSDLAVYIYHPVAMPPTHPQLQKVAHQAAQKALRQEAEKLLPQRLHNLASQHNFSFGSVSVRHLKTRWGSCDTHHHITLNYYLMQLPWPIIDYVLVHELTHTVHLNHSQAFWQTIEQHLPDYKQRRKLLKNYQPSVIAQAK